MFVFLFFLGVMNVWKGCHIRVKIMESMSAGITAALNY